MKVGGVQFIVVESQEITIILVLENVMMCALSGQIIRHLAAHPNVSFVAEYVGDPFLEFGLVVEDPYRLRGLLQGIENLFPENRVLELSLFEETLVSARPPPCVFE